MANSQFVRINFNKFPELIQKAPREAADFVEATAREGERYVKQSIAESPATGITYGNHTASSPGNPPRIDTGNLVNNINSRRLSRFLWAIRSGAEYSMVLEFGGQNIEARPFMGPMAFWLENNIEDIWDEFFSDI